MQLVATVPTAAKFNGDRILIDIQEGTQLSVTVHEALRLAREIQREAVEAMDECRQAEPKQCEVIAFPIAKVRRAIVAARKTVKVSRY